MTANRHTDITIGVAKHTNKFKAARKALGLSQLEVSKRTGIAQSVISDLETGTNTNPTWEVLSKLSRLYGRRPDELLPPAPLPRKSQPRTFAAVGL